MTTIRLANHSTFPFVGWKRCTVDAVPFPAGANADGDVRFVKAKDVGDVVAIDLFVALLPGQHREVDLDTFAPIQFERGPLPDDPVGYFGGPLQVGGLPVDLLSVLPDGAGYSFVARRRLHRMLCVYVWATWYPECPSRCFGEALVVASNPAVPDMGETVPPGAVDLTWGNAMTLGQLVVDRLADGQGKASPVSFLWPLRCHDRDDMGREIVAVPSFMAAHSGGVCAVGVTKLLTTGAPSFPPGFDARAWGAKRWAGASRGLQTWDPPVCGPAPVSGSAGEQEDSLLHAGGEALQPDGLGCEQVRYLAAIKLHAERPCNHLEWDGSQLAVDLHPRLMLWGGRPFRTGSFDDNLGKQRELTATEAHDRWGPDTQHFYHHGLFSAARLTGSPLCQFLLRNLCTVYLLQRTVDPARVGTTATWAAREWGCEGQFVQDVWMTLEDRAMAHRVVSRWRDRVNKVLLPMMADKDLLLVFNGDPRVNASGLGAQWWQESFAAWSIDETCRVVGPDEGREVAQRIARRVLDTAWTWTGDHWRAQPQGPLDGSANDQNPASDSFNHYGMPLCVATVLRVDPTHAKARAIWDQLLASTADKARNWMPPIA